MSLEKGGQSCHKKMDVLGKFLNNNNKKRLMHFKNNPKRKLLVP